MHFHVILIGVDVDVHVNVHVDVQANDHVDGATRRVWSERRM
jgi:hypothetical protein